MRFVCNFAGDFVQTVVRFEGAVGSALKKLVALGYFKTKSEAIRAGVLELGKEYGVLGTPKDLEAELVIRKMERIDQEIDEGKRKLVPLDVVLAESRRKG